MNDELATQNRARALGISHLSKEEQDKKLGEVGDLVLRAAMVRILESIPEERREEFLLISERDNHEELNAFIREHVPDVEKLVEQAVAEEMEAMHQYVRGAQ